MRDTYEEHIAKIDAKQSQAAERCRKSYASQLETLLKDMQSAGDLDGWTAIKAEVDRFKESGRVKKNDVVEKPDALKTLQSLYVDAMEDSVRTRCEGVLDLTEKYVKALEKLQVRSTKKGEVTTALAYREEAKRAQSGPKVRAAEFELAEITASEPGPASVPTPPERVEPNPEPAPPTVQPELNADEAKVIGGCRVYSGNGPSIKGTRFKRLVMKKTPDARVARGASVTVQEGDLSKVTSKDGGSSSYYFYYGSRSSVEKILVRVSVRAPSGLQNAVAVIQLFSKAVATAGSLNAQLKATYRVPVGDIDSKGVTIDCPPVETAKSRKSSYYYGGTSKSGSEFFGASVTVFAGDGTLVYQATTSPALQSFAADIKFTPSAAEKASQVAENLEAARERYDELRRVYYADMKNQAAKDLYEKARDEYYALQSRRSAIRRE